MYSKIQYGNEIEIIDHKTEDDTRFFRVKLKRTGECKWIPLTSRRILNENQILEYYTLNNVKIKDLPPLSRLKRAKNLYELFSNVPEEELVKFVRRYDNFELPPYNEEALMNELINLVPKDDEIRLNNYQIAAIRDKIFLVECHKKRRRQLKLLQEKEWSFNKLSDNIAPLFIQNNVDFAIIPDFVKYVNNYVPRMMRIPMSPPNDFGCGRYLPPGEKHRCGKDCACLKFFDAKPAYDKNGRVIQRPGERIHECNKKCRCDDRCPFRVIQKGCNIKLLIFRCSNGAGWGVKTLEYISKGTYIGRYVGEVILWKDGELLTTTNGRNHYLFDIDFIKDEEGRSTYTVDAYEYGNFTRFINHSCAPNLIVHHAFINTLDDRLHDIAFFAQKSIESGEELTFNYGKQIENCRCQKCSRGKA